MVTSNVETLIGNVRQFGRAVLGGGGGSDPVDVEILARVAQASRTSMLLTDADLDEPGPRILWVNAAFERTTGYVGSEIIGRNPRFLQGPATDRSVLAELRALLQRGEDFEGEAINYRKDGTPFVMSWRIAALRDEHGEPTHYLATQDDVTELRLRPLADRQAILELQGSLMPEVPGRLGVLEFGSAYRPADGQLVGGDWIDAIPIDDEKTLTVIGDVTGHGAGAVAVMGQMQWAIRANAMAGLTLPRIASTLRTLARQQKQYATAVLVKFRTSGEFRYLVAGHPPPIIVAPDGSSRELESTSAMIGLGPPGDDRTVTDALAPGETLVAFTDGLFERRNSSVLDDLERLTEVARDVVASGAGARDMAEKLVARMIESDSGEDDIAVMVVRRPMDGSLAPER